MHLLRERDYEDLAYGRRSLRDIGYLEAPEEQYEISEILGKIALKYIERINFLSKIPSIYSTFFKAFLEELEVENIKAKIRFIYGEEKEIEFFYPYYNFVSAEKLTKVKSLKEVEKLLKKTPLQLPLTEISRHGLDAVLMSLESKYFSYLRKEIKANFLKKMKIIDLIDYEGLSRLLYWLMILGENAVKNLDKLFIQGFYSKDVTYFLSLERLSKKLGLKYEEVVECKKSGRISKVLASLDKMLLARARTKALFNPISILYVYYYMLLCRNERKNLEKIVIGRELKLPPQIVLSSLTLFSL